MATESQKIRQEDAIKRLRNEIKPGSTLYTILRHESRSGMSRRISVVQVKRGGVIRHWDYLIAQALGEKLDPETQQGLKIDGAGMDMGFEVVYRLSSALYGGKRSYPCLGDSCPSNSHVNDHTAPRGKGKGIRHHDGYAISQRWM